MASCAEGHESGHVPAELIARGATFSAIDRDDTAGVAGVIGSGADLLVDCVCFTERQAAALVPLPGSVRSTVMISSKAVYLDRQGRHSNSDEAPRFDAPITEAQPTLRPGGEPYARGKATDPNRGLGADHPSAAANIAALVAVVAARPGKRVLNMADPDAPDALAISRVIARHLAHTWDEYLLENSGADASVGVTPWNRLPPVVLDTSAAEALGYRPVESWIGW